MAKCSPEDVYQLMKPHYRGSQTTLRSWDIHYGRKEAPLGYWAIPTNNKTGYQDLNERIPYRFTMMFLGVIGGLPFTWKSPHLPSLHLTKSTLPVALLIYSYISYTTYGLFYILGGKLRRSELLLEEIMGMQIAVVSVYHFVTLCAWSDVPLANRGLQIWLKLGASYEIIMGCKMSMYWRKLERVVVVLLILVPAAAYILGRIAMPWVVDTYAWAPAIVYNNAVTGALCSLWIGHFSSLERFAKEINKKLKDEIQNNLLTPYKCREYRRAWLAMRELSDNMSSLNSPILICVVNVGTIVFMIYDSILLYTAGRTAFAASHNAYAGLLFMLLFGMGRKCQNAIDEIKTFYSDILAMESLQGLRFPMPKEVINLYLVEKARSPISSLGGYVLVNKTLITTIFAAILTYIVILVQFFPFRRDPTP